MNNLLQHTIPLSQAVKAAAIDMGEDFTKVEATYSHWAVRGFKDLSNKVLRLGYYRAIFPVHQSLRTVQIPLGAKGVTFVGWVDDCGIKHSLRDKSNLVGQVEEHGCVEKCTECNQALDICENLTVVEETENVIITDRNGTASYQNTTTKIYENGQYYLQKKRWRLDLEENLATLVETSDFIAEFDLLKCGCIAPTDTNIATIRDNCHSCYSTCYTPCMEDSEDVGGYRVFEDYIQLDRGVGLDKVYVEWEGCLPKKNGAYHIPEIASEGIVAYIKHRATWNKKSVSITEKRDNQQDYINKMKDCRILIGRLSIDRIKDSFRKVPKMAYSLGTNSVSYGGKNYPLFKGASVTNYNIPVPSGGSGGGSEVIIISGIPERYEYVIQNEEKSFVLPFLIGKTLLSFDLDGRSFGELILTGNPEGEQVKFESATGTITVGIDTIAGIKISGLYR